MSILHFFALISLSTRWQQCFWPIDSQLSQRKKTEQTEQKEMLYSEPHTSILILPHLSMAEKVRVPAFLQLQPKDVYMGYNL